MKRIGLASCAAFALVLMTSAGAAAQGRANRLPPGGALADGGVSPAEIQQLFDAYVVMQAQQELQLSDEQYPQFLSRVRTLQDVRRRTQMERGRLLQVLRRLAQNAAADENELRTQMKALDDLNARADEQIHRAVEGVDQVLNVRQQARFRLFEEMMERRKVDLLMRARQGNRQRP